MGGSRALALFLIWGYYPTAQTNATAHWSHAQRGRAAGGVRGLGCFDRFLTGEKKHATRGFRVAWDGSGELREQETTSSIKHRRRACFFSPGFLTACYSGGSKLWQQGVGAMRTFDR